MKYNEMDACRERLEQYLADMLFPALNRSQQRKWGSVYVRGLLLEGERKSAGAMAARMPDGNEQALQQFLSDSPWDFTTARRLQAQYLEAFLPDEGVWAFDDTGFPKKGKGSVGVARQYSGTLGKVGNCQIGVSMHLGTPVGSLPLDFELYLPKEWTGDPERCKKAGVPEDLVYRPKWQIALDLLDRVRLAKLVDRIVTADAAYGKVAEFRDGLAQRGLQYAVATDGETSVWVGEVPATVRTRQSNRGRTPSGYDYGEHRPVSVKEAALALPPAAWQDVTWDQGSKGSLRSRFAAVRIHTSHGYHEHKAPRPEEWLIIEWPASEAEPTDYWLSNLPETTSLRDLVRWAKMRWHIEQDYQQLKEELGLDHFEGRSWSGWNRHVTLTMIAFGFLLLERLRGQKRGS